MKKHKIENKNLTIIISEKGAELASLKNNEDAYEYLWQGNPSYWGRRAPILFPIVGKLIDDTYLVEGQPYHMTQHGFARDEMFKVISHEDNKIVFELKETDQSLKMYPYRFKLNLTYIIEDKTLITKYRIENTNEVKMPFSIGAHPAFNTSENSQFKFEADEIYSYKVKAGGIDTTTKKIKLNKGTLNITTELFKDDALILSHMDGLVLKLNQRSITLDCSGFPYLGLWSKASGGPFVCLEPWHGLGDLMGHNQDIFEKEGIVVLQAKEIFESEYRLTFE